MVRSIRGAARTVPGLVLGAAVLLAAGYGLQYGRLPNVDHEPADPESPPARWPNPDSPDESAVSVFKAPPRGGSAGQGALSRRFRFAGTFFLNPEGPDREATRHAVLEDLEQSAQHLVGVGDQLAGVTVVAIQADAITLRRDGREETLWRSYDAGGEMAAADHQETEVPWDERVQGETAFGRHLISEAPDEDRWIISRDALIQYREQLLDHPERLANLFASMRPDRVEGTIDGYRLQPQGERAFYEGVGMQDDDIVRKVNSMKMTRQQRAEYFIREFVNDRLSAVVMEIERDGKPHKLIYYLR